MFTFVSFIRDNMLIKYLLVSTLFKTFKPLVPYSNNINKQPSFNYYPGLRKKKEAKFI
jgi:hypothetical protein